MKRLYWMILKEIAGPWVFGVAIFTTLIMTITYLFKMVDFVVQGVSIGTVLYLTVLGLPVILVKTFSMSVLLAALLAFSRLSGDSEIVALRAAGISVGRIMVPVAIFGFIVATIAFIFGETIAPGAFQKANNMKTEIAKQLNKEALRPVGYPIYEKGKLVGQLNARDFSAATGTLRGVTVIVYDRDTGKTSFYLDATEMQFEDEKEWRLRGGGQLLNQDGSILVQVDDKIWPDQVPKLKMSVQNIAASMVKDLDSYSMREFRTQIEAGKRDDLDPKQIANLEYGYYNKIAYPLAAFVFGLLGAPLGIRNHRTGVAAGYMISIAIIFGYFFVANIMGVMANGRVIPAWLASFTPVIIGCVLAVWTIHRKNV